MAHSALAPVFAGLRIALHVLVLALAVLAAARAQAAGNPGAIGLVSCFLVVYGAGGALARAGNRSGVGPLWFAGLTLLWVALLWQVFDASYLAFPLYFLALHLLGRRTGPVAVLAIAALAVAGVVRHQGWSVGGVVGPVLGAVVAILIGLAYRAMLAESREQERLLAELIATRDELAASQHESGVLAERSRIARDLHDTVAQGLSSIQLLLHAAERADGDRPGIEHVRLARETAAANLADTRRFIRELSPPALAEEGLLGALERLAGTQWTVGGLQVSVHADPVVRTATAELPMHLQTALLRIAQGAMANVIRHAAARHADIEVDTDTPAPDGQAVSADRVVRLVVRDDGRGFDVAAQRAGAHSRDSFGLAATRERVDQLGGTFCVTSAPGEGTVLTVELPWERS